MRAVICKGDRTSHGGTVTTGSSGFFIEDREMAVHGDMTRCPLCKGDFAIDTGLDDYTDEGNGAVLEGMKALCGAEMIASQHDYLLDDGGWSGAAAASPPAPQPAATPTSVPAELTAGFRLIDSATGLPVPNVTYRIVKPGGTVHGVTDADGKTVSLTSLEKATATLHLGTDAPADEN